MIRAPLRFPDASKQHPAAWARRREVLYRSAQAFALKMKRRSLSGLVTDLCASEAALDAEHARNDLRQMLELCGVGTADDARRAGTDFYLCRESGELKGVGG